MRVMRTLPSVGSHSTGAAAKGARHPRAALLAQTGLILVERWRRSAVDVDPGRAEELRWQEQQKEVGRFQDLAWDRGGSLAPMMSSQSMMATSANKTGWVRVKILSS